MNLKKIILTVSLLSVMPELFAQTVEGVANPLIINGPRFFVCIVAGLLLAIGFQVLLSTLSVASGITAVGNIKESVNSSSDKKSGSGSSMASTVKKITTGMGVWTVVTVSLSLFFASLLAVKLSLVGANFVGVSLGLVIWAAFFTGMVYLEMKSVSTLVGGFISTVRDGMQSLFSTSEESREKSVVKAGAREQAHAMRKELETLFDNRDIDHKIDQYVKELRPQKLDLKHVRNEMKKLLTDLKIEEKSEVEDGEIVKKLLIEEVESTPSMSREDVSKLSMLYDEVKEIAKSDAPPKEKVRKAVEQFTSADREEVRQYENKIKRYLQAANKDALQPETIERDIDEILHEPSHAGQIAKEKIAALDRNTIMRMVASRSDISSEDARKYAGYVEQAINKLSGNASDTSGKVSKQKEDVKSKVRSFINKIEEKRSYDLPRIKQDFTSLFNAAGKDHEGITYKIQHYNKEQLLTMVTANTSIERDQAEPIVANIVEARDSVLQKVKQVKRKVEEKLEQAKQEALQQAENTRKVAATAAWWLVATALISGVASALGGMLALDTWTF